MIVGDPISVTGPLTAAMFALMIPLYRETSTLVFSVERMDEVFADTFSIFEYCVEDDDSVRAIMPKTRVNKIFFISLKF